jgi:SAM-dependent methyltransferase
MDGVAEVKAYIREVMPAILELSGGDLKLGRSFFLNRLLDAICARVPRAAEVAAIWRAVRSDCMVGGGAGFDDSADERCKELIPAPPHCVVVDPGLLGWAYQIWNEPLRNNDSWAVSRKTSEQSETARVEVITQVFTDDYIASFLARRLLLQDGDAGQSNLPSVCDPACGGGQLLLAFARHLVRCGMSPEQVIQCIWGFDIDPHVLNVARITLFFEMLNLGYTDDVSNLWYGLQRRLRLCPAPFGVLDRGSLGDAAPQGYDVVIANPPYLGRRKLPLEMRAFLDDQYPGAKVDLCAAFIQRCVELTKEGGRIGLLTSDKWLRLQGYAPLRNGSPEFKGVFDSVEF